ncbi:MAG TPA: hypothetical protein VEX39_03545 [Thermoleophilaceae bacterium]|nr:hypothetical protein [Thermoleophilaceae bacterium]
MPEQEMTLKVNHSIGCPSADDTPGDGGRVELFRNTDTDGQPVQVARCCDCAQQTVAAVHGEVPE